MRRTLTKLGVVALVSVLASCNQQDTVDGPMGSPGLSLEGGGAPGVSLMAMGSPASGEWTIEFGQVPLGTESAGSLVFANSGFAPLQILSVGEPSDPEFGLTLTAGSAIEPGSTINVPFAFKPFSTGPKSATVVIQTDSSVTHAITFTFSGTGVH